MIERIRWFRFATRCVPVALGIALGVGLVRGVGAAPLPISELVDGYSATFLYSLSPDGRYVLRRDLRGLRWNLYPVGEAGKVGAPFSFIGYDIRFMIWARDGARLYGIRYRRKAPVVLEIDPAKPARTAPEIRLAGIEARIVSASLHPSEDDRLILWTHGRGGQRLLHCELNGAGCVPAAPDFEGAGGWAGVLGRSGRAVARFRFTGSGYEFQAREDGAWQPSGAIAVDRQLVPLSPIASDGWGLALSNRTRDTVSLVRWNVRTLEEEVVFSRPDAALASPLLGVDSRPLAVHSFPGYPETHALDPVIEEVLGLVRARHAGPAVVNVAAAAADLSRFVVEVFDEVRARVVYLVSLPGGTVAELETSRAGRYGEDFSPTRSVRIRARDGLSLPVLLTLPRDRTRPGPPPVVLMIHGGPWLFYRWTFDPLTQILASRGFAVLKLNYRGSAGYGNRFRERAVGELAGRVHDDVEDAFDWAVREGHVDGGRLAVLGDSFGGYCVLTAVLRQRLPVRAGVVLSGVVDTEAMFLENTFSAEGRALWAKYLGTRDPSEARRILRDASPLRHIDRLEAPLLFFAGNKDRIVQSRHAADLVEALRRRGREARLVDFRREGHAIVRPANVTRTYRETAEFLERFLH